MAQNIAVLKTEIGRMTPEFAKALPGHITPERFVRTAQTAVAMTRNIEKLSDIGSLHAACIKAATDGLILDGREAAIVIDYQGVAQYRPMMRGLLKLAHNSGQIRGLVVEIVHANDHFEREPTNLDQPVTHRIDVRAERGAPIAAYAIASLASGGSACEVMSVGEINRIRDRSDAYKAFKANKIKSTPWSTDWSEMARKTVFRRLSKYLPSSSDRDALHQAAERIDEDYTFDVDAPADDAPAPRPVKQRGGAGRIMKDVTPAKEAAPAEPKTQTRNRKEAAPPAEPPHDPDTGEFHDDGYIPPGDDQGETDDI